MLQNVIQGMVIFFNGWCLCMYPLNNCGHVCCVVEVNFLISCLFSSPAPAPTTQLLLSHSLNTSHVTESHGSPSTESSTEAKAMETSAVTQPNTTPRSTDTITEVTSNRTVERRKYQNGGWVTTGIVVGVMAVIIARLLISLFLHLKKKVCLRSAVWYF